MGIQKLIKQKGMSQIEVACKLGKTQQLISGWINGKSTPRFDTIVQLAVILDVTEQEIIDCFKTNQSQQ